MSGGVFKPAVSIDRTDFEWGVFALVSSPADGAEQITTVEATFLPGKCHDFHRHPGQEEVIYVLEGALEQWIERESSTIVAGDAVVIGVGVVHASFNVGDVPARILAVLSPSIGEQGYGVEDVSGEEPWASVRPPT